MKKILSLITVATLMLQCFSFASADSSFNDIENHWAKTQIEEMEIEGIAKGKADGVFDPDGIITRAEYLTLVCRIMNIKESSYSGVFSDVNSDNWYADYVQAGNDNNLIPQGMIENNSFAGDTPITREELAAISVSAGRTNQELNGSMYFGSFSDEDAISDWAKEYVSAAIDGGILKGMDDGSLSPQGIATRAQAIVMI